MKTVHKEGSMITYYIDENTKCITASISVKDLTLDVYKSIHNVYGHPVKHVDYRDFTDRYFDDKYDLYSRKPSCLKATVKPHKDDEFDEATGMKIACKKVLIKYYNVKRKVLMQFSQELSEWMKDLYKETEYASNRYAKFLQEYKEA